MKKLFILIILFSFIGISQAQVGVASGFQDGKLRVGGGLGLGFGNNGYFGFNISPYAGYMLTPQLEGGMTVGYQYAKNDFVKWSMFSVGPYANYYIGQMFFARAHYEYFTGNQEEESTGAEYDFDESALWLGGGYQSTGRVRFQAGLMYNVLYDEDESIFSSALRPFAGIAVSL